MSDACINYGFVNGSSCACPVGFGGSNCSQPACGGNIFQGSSRSLVPFPDGSNTFPNLTSSGCTCEGGWTGTGCNVCQTANACQVGLSSSGAQSVSSSITGLNDPGQNDSLVCNVAPRVYAAGQMSCQVMVCCEKLQLDFLNKLSSESNFTTCVSSCINSKHPTHTQSILHSIAEYHWVWLKRHCLRPALLCWC